MSTVAIKETDTRHYEEGALEGSIQDGQTTRRQNSTEKWDREEAQTASREPEQKSLTDDGSQPPRTSPGDRKEVIWKER